LLWIENWTISTYCHQHGNSKWDRSRIHVQNILKELQNVLSKHKANRKVHSYSITSSL
jgi:hypothetical protein